MQGNGPKYFVDIEGIFHEWGSPTISAIQIATLGGWDPSAGILEIDRDNNERQLAADEVVELKPGHGFAKKIRWQRGDLAVESRLDQELVLLRGRYGAVIRDGAWFLIPNYELRLPDWNYEYLPISFRAQVGYPGAQPYGFFVPADIQFKGSTPQNFQAQVSDRPPFDGDWGIFSWSPQDQWKPGTTPQSGSNFFNFALSFAERFRSGA